MLALSQTVPYTQTTYNTVKMTAMRLEPFLAQEEAEAYVHVRGEFAKSVLVALADGVSRKILTSTIDAAKTIEEISESQGIPLSTCYRRTKELLESGLVVVDRIFVSSGGRYLKYRSGFSAFRVVADPEEVRVEVMVTGDVADKVRSKWISMAFNGQNGALVSK